MRSPPSHPRAQAVGIDPQTGDDRERRMPRGETRRDIDRRRVVTPELRVRKATEETQSTIDVLLQREDVDVRRVSVYQPVDRPAPVRREGDVLIVPLHEEVPVITMQLVVTEELHIAVRPSEVIQPTLVTLRREIAEIERMHDSPPRAAAQDEDGAL